MSDRELYLVIMFALKEVKTMINNAGEIEEVRTAVDSWINDLLMDEYSFDDLRKRLEL